MLTVCFRSCTHRGNQYRPGCTLTHAYHCNAHPAQVNCRHIATINLCRGLSWSPQHVPPTGRDRMLDLEASLSCCHTNLCVEERGEASCATIWHGLVPSHHPSLLQQSTFSSLSNQNALFGIDPHFGSPSRTVIPAFHKSYVGHQSSAVGLKHASGLRFPDASVIGNGRFAGLLDGSWNVAWDVRPARWLHGRHSAWLLFGVCTCFSASLGISVPNMSMPMNPLLHVEGSKDSSECDSNEGAIQQKQVFKDYTRISIPGDGRCLFRAIVFGSCLRKGELAPSESSQQQLADELREKVVDELVRRRADSEWFIEEDFDAYVERMRAPYVWGGEPELLMASHVLRVPITVHLFDQSSGGIISIAEYGLEYGSEDPIRVLYHGFGHYDAIQVPGASRPSKL